MAASGAQKRSYAFNRARGCAYGYTARDACAARRTSCVAGGKDREEMGGGIPWGDYAADESGICVAGAVHAAAKKEFEGAKKEERYQVLV